MNTYLQFRSSKEWCWSRWLRMGSDVGSFWTGEFSQPNNYQFLTHDPN